MTGMNRDGGQGWGSRNLAVTHLSLFRKHVGTQKRISPASQALPHLSLLSWAHPPQAGLDQAGEAELGSMSEDLCPGVQVQGISISGEHSLQGEEGATFTWGDVGVLTGPWSCPHPIHGCAPEAGSGSNCGPGDSPGSWHLSSGSSACSGPAKDRGQPGAQMKVVAMGNRQFRDNYLC